jgi:hypothetical protein
MRAFRATLLCLLGLLCVSAHAQLIQVAASGNWQTVTSANAWSTTGNLPSTWNSVFGGGSGTIAKVQSVEAAWTYNSLSSTVTLTGVVAGNAIILHILHQDYSHNAGTYTISDGSSTWHQDAVSTITGATYDTIIASAYNVTSGTHTITVTRSAGTTTDQYGNLVATEYSGLASGGFDQKAIANNSGTAVSTGLTPTLTQASELLTCGLTMGSTGAGGTYPPTGGPGTYTALYSNPTSQFVDSDFQIQTSGTAAAGCNWGTTTGSVAWTGAIATYKATGSTNTCTVSSAGNVDLTSSTGNDCRVYRNSPAFPNNQFAAVTLNALVADSGAGTAETLVRYSNSAQSGYKCTISRTSGTGASVYLIKDTAGAHTTLAGPITVTAATGSTFGAVAYQSTLYCSINNAAISGTVTSDSTYSSGAPGLGIEANSQSLTDVILGNWSGGSINVAPPYTPPVTAGIRWHPGHYMLTNAGAIRSPSGQTAEVMSEVSVVNSAPSYVKGYGLQITWARLESSLGTYTFGQIDSVLAALNTNKKLAIFILTAGNNTTEVMPSYLLTSTYGSSPSGSGGYWNCYNSTSVCIAFWRPSVAARMSALYSAICSYYNNNTQVEIIGSGDESALTSDIYPSPSSDSSFSSAAYGTAYANVYSSATSACTKLNVQGSQVNYTFGDVSETNAAQSIALIQSEYASGVGEGWPDTYGNVDGPPNYVSWGQSAMLGHAGGAGFVYTGKMLTVAQVQGYATGTLDYAEPPSSIAPFANSPLESNYVFWEYVTGSSGANGDWSSTVLPAMNANPVTNTSCPAQYTSLRGGCNTSGLVESIMRHARQRAANDEDYDQRLAA